MNFALTVLLSPAIFSCHCCITMPFCAVRNEFTLSRKTDAQHGSVIHCDVTMALDIGSKFTQAYCAKFLKWRIFDWFHHKIIQKWTVTIKIFQNLMKWANNYKVKKSVIYMKGDIFSLFLMRSYAIVISQQSACVLHCSCNSLSELSCFRYLNIWIIQKVLWPNIWIV